MKHFITFIILLFVSSKALAEIDNIGMNFGIQRPSIKDTNAELYSPSYSERAGVSISFDLNTKMRLQIKANYSKYREKYTYTENSISSDFTSSFHYLSVSPLLKYKFSHQNSFFLTLGPDVGCLLNHSIYAVSGNKQNNLSTNKYNLMNISLSASVGYEYNINNRFSFTIELNEILGLSDISKNDIAAIQYLNPNYQEEITIYDGENNYSKINSTRVILGINYYI